MELRINSAIKSQTKVTYAIESAGPLPYDIDCGEGINIVMVPPAAKEGFDAIQFDMLRAYPHGIGVKDGIIDYWKDYAALDYKRIVLCAGSIYGLFTLNRLFLERGDRVLGCIPQFSEYGSDVQMYGCTFDSVPLKAENNYKFSIDDMLAALKPEHKAVYLDNPNNPTGQIVSLAEIERLLQAAQKNGTAVIIDEAYGDYMSRKHSAVGLMAKYDNLIVVKTFSKGFGLAGLRAGYLLIPEQLTPYMGNITTPYDMSEISRVVAERTIRDAAFLQELREKTAELKRMVLTHPWKHISVAETAETVSICLLTHRNPNVDLAEEFAKRGILVISGSDFLNIGKNSVRFRVPAAEDMPRVIAAMEEIDGIA